MKKFISILGFLFCLMITTEVDAFSDVPQDADYRPAIDWAVEKGLIKGYEDGTFRPNQKVTEAQFLKMYIRLLPFKGVKDDELPRYGAYYSIASVYHLPAVSAEFNSKPITRGAVANLIAYTKGVGGQDVNKDSAYMMEKGYSSGQNPKGKTAADKFGTKNSLARYHAVVFLYKAFKDDTTLHVKYDPYASDLILTGPST